MQVYKKRTNSLIHAQSLCSVAYLASFLSRAGRLPSFSLQEVINLLTFGAFFSFGTKGQKHVSQMGLFSLPTNLHFSQTWNLKFYPNSNEIKSGQGSRKDVRSFPFFSSKCFPPKILLKLDTTFFLFILFLFEILNFNYQQFHEFSKRNKKRISEQNHV